ncbi:MAG: hypothetical protein KIT33_15915 [Candidatus Kapabacteria bacterium]|nr:hypothetical protein [Ignavibacteriota bacterium]MCW5886458.1 hypothetical protein [Candidatus Kapabacteria bacterium]
MLKTINPEGKSLWFSEESDWNNHEGHLICIWAGLIIKQEEYSDFINFVKDEIGAEVEIIGEFKQGDLNSLVFLVKNCIPKFATWRFNFSDMRYWYDHFGSFNGGKEVEDNELMPIIEKLGLRVDTKPYFEVMEDQLTEEEELC